MLNKINESLKFNQILHEATIVIEGEHVVMTKSTFFKLHILLKKILFKFDVKFY